MNSLLSELVTSMPQALVVAPAELARWWIDNFRGRFVGDVTSTWWWEHLTVVTKAHDYGDADGLAVIDSIVGTWGLAVLIVTDEESEPIGCVVGRAGDLVRALQEVRNFEFILATPNLDHWVFDTHKNIAHEFHGHEQS